MAHDYAKELAKASLTSLVSAFASALGTHLAKRWTEKTDAKPKTQSSEQEVT